VTKFYAVIEEDRHTDVLVVVFDDLAAAIADAKQRAADSGYEDVQEDPVEGWFYYAFDESADYHISVREVEARIGER